LTPVWTSLNTKSFAYIGASIPWSFAAESNYITDKVHAAVSQSLIQRGLKEVKPDEQPDLVVRYWPIANPDCLSLARTWGQIRPVRQRLLAYTYDLMRSESALDASLVIDLIDPKRKDLAWRLYLEQKSPTTTASGRKCWEKFQGFRKLPANKERNRREEKGTRGTPPKPAAQ